MSAHSHIPRKRFGQHFLHEQQIIMRIIQAIAPHAEEHLVEIGPGLGALTQVILPLINSLDVIELDRDLIPHLQTLGEKLGNLKIYHASALQFDFSQLKTDARQLRIFGNLPYNISTPLLFHLLEYANIIQDMHFMLQKEVVERIAAKPGSKHYGRLSVMVQYHCTTELLFLVNRHAFTPPPRVESAVLRLIPHAPVLVANNLEKFSEVVRLAFNQRRKMLHNCLRDVVTAEQWRALNINPNWRPEQLTVEDFVRISNIVTN